MRANSFSVEITLDVKGVRSVRILGKDWSHGVEAHALLQRLNPLIRKLDAEAKLGHKLHQSQNEKLIQ
jgi:hypothetical protein